MPQEPREFRFIDEDEPGIPQEPQGGGFLDPMSLPRRLAGTGTRLVGGLLSSEGGPLGAAVGAGTETLAQKLEGSPTNPAVIAVEGGLGAVPLSKLFRLGKWGASALRNAIFGGVGSAGRNLATSDPEAPIIERIDPKSVIANAAFSGLVGGTVGKLSKPAAKAAEEFIVEPTAQTGRGAGTLTQVGKKPRYGPVISPRPIKAEGGDIKPIPSHAPTTPRVPYGAPSEPLSKGAQQRAKSIQALEDQFSTAVAKRNIRLDEAEQKAIEKAALEARKQRQVEEAMEGLEPQRPTVSESTSYTTPEGGRKTATTRYTPSKEEGGGRRRIDISDLDDLLSGRGGAPPRTPPAGPAPSLQPEAVRPPAPPGEPQQLRLRDIPEEAAAVTPAVAEESVSPLANIFRSRVDALGSNYRDIKAALSAGEAVPEVGRKIAGRGLQREAAALGLPTRQPPVSGQFRSTQEAIAEGQIPTAAPTRVGGLAQTSKAREAALAARRAKVAEAVSPVTQPIEGAPRQFDVPAVGADDPRRAGMMEDLQKLLDAQPLGPESGATRLELMNALGLGLGGAALGGALDPLGNPLLSAAAGGAIGAIAPSAVSALREMGIPDDIISDAGSAGGIKEAASRLWQRLPEVQRFNYLADAPGLAANAVAGPYGSTFMGSLEAMLSGDPRGREALGELLGPRFFTGMPESWKEAASLIGRSEGRAWNQAPTMIDRALAAPGTFMTSGDVSARRILESSGFTPDEARRITLTSEPELPFAKSIANFGKNSALAQILLPFKRTPANILEQGAQRVPILGSIVQAARKTPDPIRTQAVQQLLGLGTGVGAYELGESTDPETAKTMRRFVSNLGGQYSLPASIGFTAGQASRMGRDPMASLPGAIQNAIPLPAADPLYDWAKTAYGATQGEYNLPRGAVPGFMRGESSPLGMLFNPSLSDAIEAPDEAGIDFDEPLIFERR